MRLVSDHAEADLADRADAECSISVCPRVLCMPDRTDGLAGAVQHAQAFLSSLDQRPAAPGPMRPVYGRRSAALYRNAARTRQASSTRW